ncbi:hypothetical protein GF402_05705 [Candidatus Fermentibacteria bacterium]|nr:hypothetical protein [Candidatus Fermentibacteria bacterium]
MLVRVPNWLGDLVMALDSINGISKAFDEVSLWTRPAVSGFLPVFFPEMDVLPADELPDRGYDVLVLLTDSFRTAWMGMRSRIPRRVGYAGELRSFLLTRALRKPRGRAEHHSRDYERLAEAVGASPRSLELPELSVSTPPHVALFAGASYGPAKIWPHYPRLAELLAKRTGTEVGFYGTEKEGSMLRKLAGGVPGTRVFSGLSPVDLCRRLSGAVLGVGNDAGGTHLAARLGVPTVAIFGSTSPTWTAPVGPSVEIVSSGLDCSPCFLGSCPKGEPALCLERIGPEAVMEAVEGLWEDVERRRETGR